MTPEQRKKLEEEALQLAKNKTPVNIYKEHENLGTFTYRPEYKAFLAGAEAGHAIRDEEVTSLKFEVERLRKANEVMQDALKFYSNRMSYSLDDYRGVSGEMLNRVVLYGDSIEINDVSTHAGRRAIEALAEADKILEEE